jgi:hypothetical protein
MRSLFVTNATLYGLLQTVRANTVPDNQTLASNIALLRSDLDIKFLALQADLDAKIAILDAKLDQISAQVTGPETVNLNLKTATITPKELP